MQQDRLTLKAPAKINLYLKVTGRRADGYHTLETLMQKVSLFDELELSRGGRGIRLCCPGGALPENQDNLVYRAAELFLRKVGESRPGFVAGVDITLKKNIPVAAGLGGGSSDAAATLKGLDALFDLGCPKEELAAIGIRLGADVPFFLADTPAAFATGIGEVLTPVAPLAGYSVLLVNPGFSVSTQWVYQTFALTKKENEGIIKNFEKEVVGIGAPDEFMESKARLAAMRNDLEAVTASKWPGIEQIKGQLVAHGAAAALMSGSGPTVFGLFAERASAESCLAFFKRRFERTYLVSPLTGEQ